MSGTARLKGRDLYEIIDLYRWGARVSDLEMLYGFHCQTIRRAMKARGVKMRAPHAPPLVSVKPHTGDDPIKSTRPQLPAGVLVCDESQAPDRLLRSSAHAQRDRRIAERQSGASTGSCPEEASECRYAFLRSGNRLPDLG